MKAITFDARISKYVYSMLMGKIDRKFHYSALSCVKLGDVAEPVLPGEDWVKVKTIYGGICGSDTNLVYLHDSPALSPFASKKFVIGHENIGVIVEKGRNVEGFGIGDRVVADIMLGCDTRQVDRCPNCQKGEFNLCSSFTKGALAPGTIMGTCETTGGSWGEYYLAHQSQLFKVPENLKDEEAILIDPLCSALHPVIRNFPEDGEKVLVIGSGIIGLMAVASLRAMGSKAVITVAARHRFQGELALKYGADKVFYTSGDKLLSEAADMTGGEICKPMLGESYLVGGFDRIFDCVGSERSIKDAMRLAASGGKLVLVGLAAEVKLDWALLWFKELSLKGTYCYGNDPVEGKMVRTYQLGLDILSKHSFDTAPLVTHVFPLADFKQAIETASSKGKSSSIKVLLKP